MKLNVVRTRELANTEFFEFLKLVAAIINKYGANTLKIKTIFDALEAIFTNLQAGLDKEKSNQLTKILNDLDFKRDVLIDDFTDWLEIMQRFPDTAMAAKADVLYHYLSGFGKNVAGQTQLAESTILTNIVDGFTTDIGRKDALAAINGTPWITALGAVNADFISQYANRIADDSNNNKVESFSSLRKRTTIIYNDVIDLLSSRYKNEKADNNDITVYENCISEINELIGKINILVQTSKPNAPKIDPIEKK